VREAGPRRPGADPIAWLPEGGDASSMNDERLAMLIRERGRARLATGGEVDLGELLRAIPGLEDRRAPLDAAIDMALRSRSGGSKPDPDAVADLVGRWPALEEAIQDAAVLGQALWTTHGSGSGGGVRSGPPRPLPSDFGPALECGTPRYRLVERLGGGASGEVYRAIDRQLSDGDEPALVAVKVLRGGRGVSRASRERFAEEAAKARRLDHPNVVRVYDRDVSPEGEDFIVQELVRGGTLHAWREDAGGPMGAREAAGLVARIAGAIQAAHSAGLTHLDLKPANILMTPDGEPKVADFGLALRVGARRASAPGAGGLPIGTLAFMAPEQFRGEDGALAPPADIYALGGILWWLLTDRLPNGDDAASIRRAHETGERDDAALRATPGMDRDLLAICRRALAPDRASRYDAAGRLASDLGSWLRREPIAWTSPGAMRVATLFARRHPGIAALTVTLLASLVGGIIALEAARRFADRAHANELEARVQAERLEAEKRWKARSSEDLARLMRGFTHTSESGLAGEVLISLWMLEWIHGPRLLADPDDLPILWAERMGVIEELLAQRRAEGGRDSLEALQLEALLGFWLARAGDHARAEPLLERNLAVWRSRLDPGDPWLSDLEAIRLCAAVSRLDAAGRASAFGERERAECFELQRRLRDHEKRLRAREDGAQLRLMILERLALAFGRHMLANDPWRAWAEDQRSRVGLSARAG
jgi:hypothetical protein